ELVGPGPAVEGVVAVAADERVVAVAAREDVVAALAEELVVAAGADERVVAVAADEVVGRAVAHQVVVAALAPGPGPQVGHAVRESVVAGAADEVDLGDLVGRERPRPPGVQVADDQARPGR